MEHRIYWIIAGLIAALVGADMIFNGSAEIVFLARKVLMFVEALSFWRH